MKKWAYYNELKNEPKFRGFKDEILQRRSIVLEHPDDVQGHRCLVSGHSLPMRLTLGSVCDTFRFLPARFDEKYTKHLVSVRVSGHSDKMRIVTSRLDQSFHAQIVDWVRRGVKICAR
jgi:hypothetical protein